MIKFELDLRALKAVSYAVGKDLNRRQMNAINIKCTEDRPAAIQYEATDGLRAIIMTAATPDPCKPFEFLLASSDIKTILNVAGNYLKISSTINEKRLTLTKGDTSISLDEHGSDFSFPPIENVIPSQAGQIGELIINPQLIKAFADSLKVFKSTRLKMGFGLSPKDIVKLKTDGLPEGYTWLGLLSPHRH